MKTQWIRRNNAPDAIVFFNGWGMDERVLSCAPAPDAWDLVVFHDYTVVSEPCGLSALRKQYKRLVLVAWSMGVWAADCVQSVERVSFDRAVALNGTCLPIDDRYGIPPALYRATAARFSEQTRDAFYRRMCGRGEPVRRFLEHVPRRCVDDQRRELLAIRRHVESRTAPVVCAFDVAFVGTRDAIMPPDNQRCFWESRARVCVVDMPHFPFAHLTWPEILGDDPGNR